MIGRSKLGGTDFDFYPLRVLASSGVEDPTALPMTVKVLLEGLLRLVDRGVTEESNVASLARWPAAPPPGSELALLRWAQQAFHNFSLVPPGMGICHQVNLEHLAKVVQVRDDVDGRKIAIPDTLMGTDSHTTMVNGRGVMGWGTGGIEAEAAIRGQPAD